MKAILAAGFLAALLAGCSQTLTPAQDAQLVSVGAVTGAAVAGALSPKNAATAATVGGAVAAGATSAGSILATPAAPAK